MRFSVISVSLLSLFASSALAIPASSGSLSCSQISQDIATYQARLDKASDASSEQVQAAQNAINSAKNLETAQCGSSSKRSYYPPESTGLIVVLNTDAILITQPSANNPKGRPWSVNGHPTAGERTPDVPPGIVPVNCPESIFERWRNARRNVTSA
ncbi:hypothetical protein BO94DRAFT_548398 [Aspergillus sclerotioniger CBS 115572]|uniref:Uncharacterized protein n=1 Tax=Aspergillus sclerotioniger CBS 115572 TaxID=1450535 RepID=A0A317W194_9EURO|nr:hypothetical protein BO94DRAFT_548398 [Aspergillus sclerotioniger CBS 115572]PWY80414.1 hypothetical protein BO94DRAFT_548398 [Aspergillus sclerotioniger CBS 115572]